MFLLNASCFFFLILLLLLFSSPPCSPLQLTDPLEVAPGSYIRGIKRRAYEEFLWIPYAQPPIDDLRFKNPQPLPLWTGQRDPQDRNATCWEVESQFDLPVEEGDEDCLYLNIFRPNSAGPSNPLPVIVFIHGGGFHSGTNHPKFYGPEFFMETQQVILVTVSYRLNIFGFLDTGDLASPGNYGLKDQTMALRWVNRNIAAFGGDPNAVTLMGHEAGGVAANYHLLSPLSKGLFRGVILMSGFAYSVWAHTRRNQIEFVHKFVDGLRFGNSQNFTTEELVVFLRAESADRLVANLRRYKQFPKPFFVPSVEPKEAKNAFLTETPQDAMKRKVPEVPVLMSFVPGDGVRNVQHLIREHDPQDQEFFVKLHEKLPHFLMLNRNNPHIGEIVRRVVQRYFGGGKELLLKEFRRRLVQLSSDYYFKFFFYMNWRVMWIMRDAPVFTQMFNFQEDVSFSKTWSESSVEYGAVLMDDLLHLFPFKRLFGEISLVDEAQRFTYMIRMVRFATEGDPGYSLGVNGRNREKMVEFSEEHRPGFRSLVDLPKENYDFWGNISRLFLSAYHF